MLTCVSSHEISEWMAFERAFGPIGPEYRDRALAAIHSQIKQLCAMFGQVNFEDFDPDDLLQNLPMPDELYDVTVRHMDETEE